MLRIGWMARMVLVGVVAATVAEAGPVCLNCSAFAECESGGAGGACASGKLFDIPFCLMWGSCGGGGGDPDDGLVRPRHDARPASGAASRGAGDPGGAAAEAVLSLHLLRMPIRIGFDPFPNGSSAFVVRSARDPRSARGLLAAIATRARVTTERIPVCEETVLLGGGRLEGAFAAADGDGYLLLVEPAAGQLRVRLCGLRGRMPAATLLDTRLRDDDVVFARVRGEGREYALVLSSSVAPSGDAPALERQRDERRAFHDEAGPLTVRAPYDGVRFMPAEVPPGGCR